MNAAPETSVDFGAEDNARLAAVCGPLDENLHQIENRLGIEIRRRSGRFSLRGANAAAGAAVLRQLYERAAGRPVTPEDVWNAAVRAGVDPARMALSLCHVLGEVTLAELDAGAEDDPATVRFTLATGDEVRYDATFHNPFARLTARGA